jgi:hypothetical protein
VRSTAPFARWFRCFHSQPRRFACVARRTLARLGQVVQLEAEVGGQDVGGVARAQGLVLVLVRATAGRVVGLAPSWLASSAFFCASFSLAWRAPEFSTAASLALAVSSLLRRQAV